MSRKKPKGDAIAASFIRDRSLFSTLYFRPAIFDDREEARRDVIHELLHCHLRATGLSVAYCSRIKRGDRTPHPRWWQRLVVIAER